MISIIFADFNNADSFGRLRLNVKGSIDDIAYQKLMLHSGMKLRLTDGDLVADGVVEYSSDENIWVAKINWDNCFEV